MVELVTSPDGEAVLLPMVEVSSPDGRGAEERQRRGLETPCADGYPVPGGHQSSPDRVNSPPVDDGRDGGDGVGAVGKQARENQQ